jgi:probable HAF family extracellular repeat protein
MSAPERYVIVAAVIGAAACADVGGPGTSEYEVIDLGALLPECSDPARCESRAYDINDAGQIVGFHTEIGPFLLDGATLTILPGAPNCLYRPGKCGYAVSINEAGQVVGQLDSVGSYPWGPGVLWSGGAPISLNLLGTDVDDAGLIVGSVWEGNLDGSIQVAAVQGPDSITRIGTLAGGRGSEATAIGSAGHVVGWSEVTIDTVDGLPGLTIHAFVWQPSGGMVDLGPVGVADPEFPYRRRESWANAVNGLGEVVGWFDGGPWDALGGGYDRWAVIWRNGTAIQLRPLGPPHSIAMDINDAGWIVGGSRDAQGQDHAVLWRDDEVIDLGTLPGYVASHAYRINEAGDIVGFSFGRDGTKPWQYPRATLWRRVR